MNHMNLIKDLFENLYQYNLSAMSVEADENNYYLVAFADREEVYEVQILEDDEVITVVEMIDDEVLDESEFYYDTDDEEILLS